jgi:hypothetical protein
LAAYQPNAARDQWVEKHKKFVSTCHRGPDVSPFSKSPFSSHDESDHDHGNVHTLVVTHELSQMKIASRAAGSGAGDAGAGIGEDKATDDASTDPRRSDPTATPPGSAAGDIQRVIPPAPLDGYCMDIIDMKLVIKFRRVFLEVARYVRMYFRGFA